MTHEDLGGEGVGGATVGEGIESDFGSGVFGLTESGAVVRALEDLAVKVDGGLEPRRVIGTFSNARVRRQVEAAPLGQLLKLVLVHFHHHPLLSLSPEKTVTTRGSGRIFRAGPGR